MAGGRKRDAVPEGEFEYYQYWAWAWDVSRAIRLTRGRAPAGIIDVKRRYLSWERRGVPSLDRYRDRAMGPEIDTSVPGLVLELDAGGRPATLLIDGWHRLYRAYHDGHDTLPVHVLSAADAEKIQLAGCPWHLVGYWRP